MLSILKLNHYLNPNMIHSNIGIQSVKFEILSFYSNIDSKSLNNTCCKECKVMLTTQDKHNLGCQRVATLEGWTSTEYDWERAVR